MLIVAPRPRLPWPPKIWGKRQKLYPTAPLSLTLPQLIAQETLPPPPPAMPPILPRPTPPVQWRFLLETQVVHRPRLCPMAPLGFQSTTTHLKAPVDDTPVLDSAAIYTPQGTTINCIEFTTWEPRPAQKQPPLQIPQGSPHHLPLLPRPRLHLHHHRLQLLPRRMGARPPRPNLPRDLRPPRQHHLPHQPIRGLRPPRRPLPA